MKVHRPATIQQTLAVLGMSSTQGDRHDSGQGVATNTSAECPVSLIAGDAYSNERMRTVA
jgi:hypothetical protein